MRKTLIILVLLVLAAFFAVASWAVTETVVTGTSDVEFCGGCHTMTPMVASYRNDVHGGAGQQGVESVGVALGLEERPDLLGHAQAQVRYAQAQFEADARVHGGSEQHQRAVIDVHQSLEIGRAHV